MRDCTVADTPKLYGGIEAGGTKFNCVLGRAPNQVISRARFPTTTPKETLAAVIDFFAREQDQHGPIGAFGLACFGPVDLNPDSSSYGHITRTPKPHWSNIDILGQLSQAFEVPFAFDTDVNGSALGEGQLGAAQGLSDYVYVTIGTGVGAGVVVNGQPLHGTMHPEIGHILMPHDWQQDPFAGNCPFHGDCLEGLAAGPAIEKRWGQKAIELGEEHQAWELEAQYLAVLCWNLTASYAPQRIILGGGVMQQTHLFARIREKFQHLMNGYPTGPETSQLDSYIVAPQLGGDAGEAGAIIMAQAAALTS